MIIFMFINIMLLYYALVNLFLHLYDMLTPHLETHRWIFPCQPLGYLAALVLYSIKQWLSYFLTVEILLQIFLVQSLNVTWSQRFILLWIPGLYQHPGTDAKGSSVKSLQIDPCCKHIKQTNKQKVLINSIWELVGRWSATRKYFQPFSKDLSSEKTGGFFLSLSLFYDAQQAADALICIKWWAP